MKRSASLFLIILVLACSTVLAQTSAFTYQGKLTTGGSAASVPHDFTFKLFSLSTGGTQVGSDLIRDDVPVTSGIFAVNLDFGSPPFTSASGNYLEIWVRPGTDTGAYTPLSPRQPITKAPYSIQALNADTATTAANFSGSLSGEISGMQGATVVTTVGGQSAANVASATQSINTATSANTPDTLVRRDSNGDFSANIVTAATQFNIGGFRVLGNNGTNNFFAGVGAGFANTTGFNNAFFGRGAGEANTTAAANSFFGSGSGQQNIMGNGNSFFGSGSGFASTAGNNNSFFGIDSGPQNTNGNLNSFFGSGSGFSNTTGNYNAFFGTNSGNSNTTGSSNTLLGNAANVGAGNLNFATAIGSGSIVAASNTVVLGRSVDTVQIPGNLNVAGTFTGNINGASITNLNASNIATGTLNPALLGNGVILNGNLQQAASNFNISGNGTAGGTLSGLNINSIFEYRLGGQRFANAVVTNLTLGLETGLPNLGLANTYIGYRAGASGTSNSSNNAFFGANTGKFNSNGHGNSFFGSSSGEQNTFGGFNSFFGNNAGVSNINGSRNAFFGVTAGRDNTSGDDNTFVGSGAGQLNQSGSSNSFFGSTAGFSTGSGSLNSFFGNGAGDGNVSGTSNTAIGSGSIFGGGDLSFATVIGAGATVSSGNSVVLGRIADTVRIPGSLTVAGPITGTVANATTASNALNLGGVAANQFVQTADARLSDARAPLPGSSNYIQNNPATAQAASNFNISGTGTSSFFNASVQYNLGGNRILSIPGFSNIFVGLNAGAANTTGTGNLFVGGDSGLSNITGFSNSFFGSSSGRSNSSGNANSFFGTFSGEANRGHNNSFFGQASGRSTNANGNSFFGSAAGSNTSTGATNTFVGFSSGGFNTTGSNNTVIGANAHVGSNVLLNISNSTAIGADAMVLQNDSIVLGSVPGINGGTANMKVGIGTATPAAALHVNNGSIRVTGGGMYIANPNTLIITSPNGACWGITVNNAGGLSTFPVSPCP